MLKNTYHENFRNYDLSSLKFLKNFSNQGKQGVVGILEDKDGKQCVYKMSQYINYLSRHEATIMNSLNTLQDFCPHFCRIYKTITHNVPINYTDLENPFEPLKTSKNIIEVETNLMEYVPSKKFYNYIKNRSISEDVLYSNIKQVLLAVDIAQEHLKFTHYDLHSCNVLLNQCDKDLVFLYSLENDHFAVPTFGYYPTIIDFGFSHCKDLLNDYIWSSLAHTDVGFMTNQFDPIADPKLFLVNVSDEIKKYRNSKNSITLRNIVRNVFEPLDIQWDCGWDNYSNFGAANFITDRISHIENESKVFDKYNHYCVDLIQTLIKLPINEISSDKHIEEAYTILITEFYKFEKEISNTKMSLYLFKLMVENARNLYDLYTEHEFRDDAVKKFKQNIQDYILKNYKYCMPKGVNYEKILLSLYLFAECSTHILNKRISRKNKQKNKQYKKLELNNPIQIYGAIETNIPSSYKYNKNTKIMIFDTINKTRNMLINLSDDLINKLNNTHPLFAGDLIYEYTIDNKE